LQTWQDYIPSDQLEFNSTYVIYRNRHYPPGSLNTSNYHNTSLGMGEMTLAAQRWYPTPDKIDPVANFSAWCWTTQIFQAEYYGSQIQFYRRGSGLPQRTLGSLYWQLEDQWAAPTWAGIEVGGRWKVLHYRAKDLYSNVIVSPFYNQTTTDLEIWVTSDLWEGASGTVDAAWYFYNGTEVSGITGIRGQNVTVGALNSTKVNLVNLSQSVGETALPDLVMRMNISVEGKLPNDDETTIFTHTNWFHASPLSQARLVDPGLKLIHDEENQSFTITAVTGLSAWTWLDYSAGVIVNFEDNGFWLGKAERKTLGYKVTRDTTNGTWIESVTVQSLWNNTLAI
jgi:beta-mannosidase